MAVETSISENPFTVDNGAGDDPSSLARAIQEHLDLKQRTPSSTATCRSTATGRGSVREPSAVQVRGAGPPRGDARRCRAAPELHRPRFRGRGRTRSVEGAALDDGLWGRSRDFDWGE